MTLLLKDSVYDVLKWIVIVVLPAISALYYGLAGIWNWPYAEKVVGTIALVQVFLGAVLCISTIGYNKEQNNGGVD